MRHLAAWHKQCDMVGVAQLVEHRIVTPGVVGSIPIVHPIFQNPRHIVWGFCFRVLSADVVELVDTLDLGVRRCGVCDVGNGLPCPGR